MTTGRRDDGPEDGGREDGGRQVDGREERPKVKVTDKRRVRPDGDAAPEVPAEGGAPAASDELERARKEAAEYLDHLQRLKAEFENYRKRVLREQTQALELASQGLVLRLLEVLDEFELALVAAEQKPDFDKFLRGVEMVYGKLTDILRQEGLERIAAKGRPFDPEQHEALLQSGEDDEGEPYVTDVLRNGYRLRGRVIRPAGVKVGRR